MGRKEGGETRGKEGGMETVKKGGTRRRKIIKGEKGDESNVTNRKMDHGWSSR